MRQRFTSFEDLAEALEKQRIDDFHIHYSHNDWTDAYNSIKEYPLLEQQKLKFKKDVARVYYEMFKIKLSNQDYGKASELINHAHELDAHNDLYISRRDLFNNRKVNREITIDDAERELLQLPKCIDPNFNYIEKNYSMGTYKWKGDPERRKHKWSNFIAEFKNGDKQLSLLLGNLLGDFILKRTDLVKKCDIIVPVASDFARSYKRGFEITQVLAHGVSQVLAMPVVGAYLERETTGHARNISKYELVNSYFSKPNKAKQIKGKTILMIDDICTTGRTLDICAEILIKGGADIVYSAVLGRAESSQKRKEAIISVNNGDRVSRLAAWYRLSRAEKLGPVKIQSLIKRYDSPEKILSLSEDELKTNNGIGEKVAQGIINQVKSDTDYYSTAAEQYEVADSVGSIIIDIRNSIYPKILYKSKMPSPVIHIRGNMSNLDSIDKSIAVVGSRNISKASKEFIQKIIPELVNDGWTIVSGMALGVDAEAHLACLQSGGHTIGVLGCGVDVVYPKENTALFSRMVTDGILLSEYNLKSRVSEIKLKRRNKIIAGLSNVVFVVQTTPNGGAINAVHAAGENTRLVITWNPDEHIKDERYSGNREIIQKGIGFGVTAYNITKQITEICQKFNKSVKDQLSLL